MPAFAITGTIGSGKSRALHSLTSLLGAESFCADDANRQLLGDSEVRMKIISSLGSSCYHSDGSADRKHLFSLIRLDRAKRRILEEILHPRIAQLWKPQAARFRTIKNSFFLAEIPLLYEKHLERYFDKVIVVGCSDSIRRKRLLESRSLTAADAEAWSTMQESQEVKISRTDHLIWNDGSLPTLQLQIRFLASHLLES